MTEELRGILPGPEPRGSQVANGAAINALWIIALLRVP
jgi:hypothetical protein